MGIQDSDDNGNWNFFIYWEIWENAATNKKIHIFML